VVPFVEPSGLTTGRSDSDAWHAFRAGIDEGPCAEKRSTEIGRAVISSFGPNDEDMLYTVSAWSADLSTFELLGGPGLPSDREESFHLSVNTLICGLQCVQS
jgi:hypothetical protein